MATPVPTESSSGPGSRARFERGAGALALACLLPLAACDGAAAEGPFALGFDGGEDCVEVDVSGLTPADAWTVELWIRGDPEDTERARPMVEWKGVFSLAKGLGGDTTFVVGETDGVSWGTSVVDGVLHHVAGTFDGERASLFVDGVRQAFADGAAPVEPTATMRIGCDAAAGAYGGLLDEVRLSSVVRYDEDFDRPVAAFEADADTIALFHFDEGEGEEATDAASGLVAGVYGPEWIAFDIAEGG